MTRYDFNFTHDDIINLDKRLLWNTCDFWREDSNGCPHRLSAGYNGEKWTVKVPDCIPMKYKGRKLTSLIVYCFSNDTVKDIEAHYSRDFALLFREPDFSLEDVSEIYRKRLQ